VFHGVPQIETTTPYRMIKMDLKKMLALAMLALVALPSLTIVGATDVAGPAGAIERARIYLDKVMTSAENTAAEYPEDHMIHGYLNQIYALLGRYDYEGPEFLLQSENGIAERSDVQSHSGTHSVHLETIGKVNDGDEARIVIPISIALADLDTISWWIYTVAGYPAHVDIFLDTGDVLTAEMAVNNFMDYGILEIDAAMTVPAWLQTFELSAADGYGEIDNATVLWVANLGSGTWNAPSGTLAQWKAGSGATAGVGDPSEPVPDTTGATVTKLEIEVDNWIVQTEAYVDDIKINKDTYDFEEREEEEGKAKYYLDKASASLVEGDIRSAARSLSSARNIIGRVNGLLKSMAKAHKVTRTEKFNRRIQGIKDKIERPKGPKK